MRAAIVIADVMNTFSHFACSVEKNAVETSDDGEPGDPRVAKLNEILAAYVGTHCFANFTEGLTGSDDSAKR